MRADGWRWGRSRRAQHSTAQHIPQHIPRHTAVPTYCSTAQHAEIKQALLGRRRALLLASFLPVLLPSLSSSILLTHLFGSSPQNLEFFHSHSQFHLHSHSASSLLSGSLLRHIPLSRVSILLSSCLVVPAPTTSSAAPQTYPCKFRSGRRLSSSDTNKRPRTTSFCSRPSHSVSPLNPRSARG